MQKKIHAIISDRIARVNRVDVISSIAGYITPPPTPFLERYKNAVGVCDGAAGVGDGGAINASNARAHERPEGSSRFQDAHVYARSSAECRAALTAIRAPRVLLSLRQLPTPLLPLRVFTRTCSEPGLRPSARSRSEWANFSRTRGTSISSTYFYSLRQFGDRWT